jgi:pyruvate kinase
MLSGETANGAFPVAAVTTMASIATEAENLIDYKKLYYAIMKRVPTPVLTPDLLASA